MNLAVTQEVHLSKEQLMRFQVQKPGYLSALFSLLVLTSYPVLSFAQYVECYDVDFATNAYYSDINDAGDVVGSFVVQSHNDPFNDPSGQDQVVPLLYKADGTWIAFEHLQGEFTAVNNKGIAVGTGEFPLGTDPDLRSVDHFVLRNFGEISESAEANIEILKTGLTRNINSYGEYRDPRIYSVNDNGLAVGGVYAYDNQSYSPDGFQQCGSPIIIAASGSQSYLFGYYNFNCSFDPSPLDYLGQFVDVSNKYDYLSSRQYGDWPSSSLYQSSTGQWTALGQDQAFIASEMNPSYSVVGSVISEQDSYYPFVREYSPAVLRSPTAGVTTIYHPYVSWSPETQFTGFGNGINKFGTLVGTFHARTDQDNNNYYWPEFGEGFISYPRRQRYATVILNDRLCPGQFVREVEDPSGYGETIQEYTYITGAYKINSQGWIIGEGRRTRYVNGYEEERIGAVLLRPGQKLVSSGGY